MYAQVISATVASLSGADGTHMPLAYAITAILTDKGRHNAKCHEHPTTTTTTTATGAPASS